VTRIVTHTVHTAYVDLSHCC